MKTHYLLASLTALALASGVHAQTPSYSAELLGPAEPGWSLTAVVAVNDDGRVAGNSYRSGWRIAWVADAQEGLRPLPQPPGADDTRAYDINSAGVVVGSTYMGGVTRAVVWTPGPAGYEALLVPADGSGNTPFNATGINDRGDVVGKLTNPFAGSYVWNAASGLTQITSQEFPKIPYDINEQRQVISGVYRMDLDTMLLENLGVPTGTSYSYISTELTYINDAGEAGGYATTATSSNWRYLAVRITPPGDWKLLNTTPVTSASVLGLAASGDTAFQLGASFGRYVYVNGVGSLSLQGLLGPGYQSWDLSNTYFHTLSRGGLIATTGVDTSTSEGGVVLLTPIGFENLGGAAPGALGDPVLNGTSQLAPGSPTRIRLSSAAPNRTALFAWAASSNPVPLFGGTFHATPANRIVAITTDDLGRVDVTFDWPPTASAGMDFFLQAAVSDPATATGFSMSNALRGVTQ